MSRQPIDRARWHAVLALSVALLAGCRSDAPRSPPVRPPPGVLRGAFELTYYWIADQPVDDAGDTTLYNDACEPLAAVSSAFAAELEMSGTGRLADNRVLGVSSDCTCKRSPCWRVLSPDRPWGEGVGNRPLVPFASIAVDPAVIPIGSRFYIKELDGALLPGTFPSFHDGCVIADDVGERIRGQRTDWYVGRRAYYRALDKQLGVTRVTLHDGGKRCP